MTIAPSGVDQMRREALKTLRDLGVNATQLKRQLIKLLDCDPLLTSVESPVDDEAFMSETCARIDRECQALLYLVTGLYGREAVAQMSGVADGAEPVQ